MSVMLDRETCFATTNKHSKLLVVSIYVGPAAYKWQKKVTFFLAKPQHWEHKALRFSAYNLRSVTPNWMTGMKDEPSLKISTCTLLQNE